MLYEVITLGFFETGENELRLLVKEPFSSRDHGTLAAIVQAFVTTTGLTPERACFGIAGPVRGNRVGPPNLPWVVDGPELAALLGLPQVTLINDLQAPYNFV